jgi:hypothetical protein
MAHPLLVDGQRVMLTGTLHGAPTQCRETLAKRLQKVCELSGAAPAIERGEVVVVALTSPG